MYLILESLSKEPLEHWPERANDATVPSVKNAVTVFPERSPELHLS